MIITSKWGLRAPLSTFNPRRRTSGFYFFRAYWKQGVHVLDYPFNDRMEDEDDEDFEKRDLYYSQEARIDKAQISLNKLYFGYLIIKNGQVYPIPLHSCSLSTHLSRKRTWSRIPSNYGTFAVAPFVTNVNP